MDEHSDSVIRAVVPGDAAQAAPTEPAVYASSNFRSSWARDDRTILGHRSGRLWIVVFILVLVLAGPVLLGRFVYHATYNELKAGYDVATSTLDQLKPRLNDLELASRLVAKRVEPSVVSIVRPTGRDFEGQGSGVIVDEAGYIVTNFHVVAGAREVQVRLSDRRITEARIVGDDALTDMAVLKIDLPNLIAAEWGNSDQLEVGDLVWALGSPFGLDHTLTFGILSAKARRSGSRKLFSTSLWTSSAYQEYLQTDAAVNPGNSGGPLVNIEGQVVGINAAIFGPAYQGISFAIPSSLAREKYEQLRANGRVERAWLGIEPADVPDSIREQLGLKLGEGVLVANVESGTPAARSGVQRGDVILSWNQHSATDPTLLSRAIAATQIGSTAKLVMVRGSGSSGREQIALDVPVERRPPLEL